MKTRFFRFLTLIISFSVFSAEIFAQEVYQGRTARFAMWASTEAIPGIEKTMPKGDVTSLPVQKIRQIAPFILSGMVYGWEFDYTPYDKKRGVKEFFEFKPIRDFSSEEISRIKYESPWIKDQRLNVWVEYDRTESQRMGYDSWCSVNYPNIKGVGYAPLEEGFEGIQKACAEALKEAVREYERRQIKNKPKEIIGKVLMSKPPLIGIDAGRYMVTLDFFMQSDRIIEYKTF